MERILVLFFCLFSGAVFAATPGSAPVITIASPGSNTQSLSIPLSSLSGTGVNGVFSIYGGVGSSSSGSYYPFYKNGVAYQVSSGKTAVCFNWTASSGAGAGTSFMLVSATASITPGTGSITGGVLQCGVASGSYCVTPGSTTANLNGPVPGIYSFAASTYAGFYTTTNTITYNIHGECFEY